MLDILKPAPRNTITSGFDVEILSLATANPPHRLAQADAAARAKELYPHLKKMWRLFDNTCIETRYNCEPIEWYLQPHSWEERSASFQTHALALFERLTHQTTAAAGIDPSAIDMIVTNTVTGLAVPSLDARLINRLGLSPTIERLPMFGLGCGAGVAGLARASRLAHAMDGAHVLFLTVDLCSLCMRVNDPSASMFVSSALFGDGAAGVLLRNTRGGGRVADPVADRGAGPRILAAGEWCWRGTEHIMGWDIKNDGFGIVLSPDLPALMSEELKPAVLDFLERNGFTLSDLDGFLFHPGGRRLLETAEQVLGLAPAQLEHSWSVLRDFGNMSSATVLFALDRAMKAGARGKHLLAAFGPGFSAYFVVAEL
jgi:alkylresorcinol/alkylpyrone synthase